MFKRLQGPLFDEADSGGLSTLTTANEKLTADLVTVTKKYETAIGDLNTLQEQVESGDLAKKAIAKQVKKGTLWDAERYGPLQTKYNEALAEGKVTTAKLEENTTQIENLTSNVGDLKTKLTDQVKLFEEATASAQTEKDENARLSMIISEFPALATLEAENLLPQADTLDALRAKLTSLTASIKTSVDAGVQSRVTGTGLDPAGPNTAGDPALIELRKQRDAAALKGDWDAWDDLQDQIHKHPGKIETS